MNLPSLPGSDHASVPGDVLGGGTVTGGSIGEEPRRGVLPLDCVSLPCLPEEGLSF